VIVYYVFLVMPFVNIPLSYSLIRHHHRHMHPSQCEAGMAWMCISLCGCIVCDFGYAIL
jgi:hypothetical protein